MLSTIMTICGYAFLVSIAFVALAAILIFKNIQQEDTEKISKTIPMMIFSFMGLFLSGGGWAICWIISLFA
jgi:hypothetical protein